MLSPVFDESYDFLSDIYSEMIPAFNAPIFNVNCDETFDLGKGYSKKLVDSLGYAEVYKQHILRLYKDVKKYNTRMMIWGDVVLKYPEILDELPKDILIAMWDYGAEINVDAMTDPIINKGFELFMVPGLLNSRRLFPDYEMTISNMNNVLRTKNKRNILGTLLTIWDAGGFTFFGNDWYGTAYNANISWRFNKISNNQFDEIFSKSILKDNNQVYISTLIEFQKLIHLQPTFEMNNRVLRIPIINHEKKIIGVSLKDWDKVEKITNIVQEKLSKEEEQKYDHDFKCLGFINKVYNNLAREKLLFKNYKPDSNLNHNELMFVIENYRQLEKELQKIWQFENRKHFYFETKNILIERREALETLVNSNLSDYQITIGKGKYFLEWLATRPIKVKNKNDAENNFIASMGEEGNVYPKVTQEFEVNGITNRWYRKISPVDITNIFEFGKSVPGVLYLYATIQSENKISLNYKISTNAEAALFLNGKNITENQKYILNLQNGKNHLMIKLYSEQRELYFKFKVDGAMVVNSKNRYKVIH